MKTIFKEGDRVYFHIYGWGEIFDIDVNVGVKFENLQSSKYFNEEFLKALSFTEYTLEGFSQERPEPAPKPGDIVWVRDTEYDSWMITYFRRFSTDAKLRYGTNAKNSDNSQYIYYYRFLTTKNPYANE